MEKNFLSCFFDKINKTGKHLNKITQKRGRNYYHQKGNREEMKTKKDLIKLNICLG